MNDLTLYPADLAALSVAQLAALPPEQKAEISRNLDEALAWLKQARAKFDAALEAAYGEQARAARLAAGKDFGVVHLTDGALRVTVDVPKRVAWDQAQLSQMARRIAAAGECVRPCTCPRPTRRWPAWTTTKRPGIQFRPLAASSR